MTPKRLAFLWVILVAVFLITQVTIFLLQPSLEAQERIENKSGDIRISPQHLRYNPNPGDYQKSCSDLFGSHQLQRFHNGTCLRHSLLNWASCNIGSISIDTSKIYGSVGGEPLNTVMNRSAEIEFLNFTKGSLLTQRPVFDQLKTLTLDPVMTNFLNSAVTSSDHKDRKKMIDDDRRANVTLLVRRPVYANPCHALISMYNVYLVTQYFSAVERLTLDHIYWLDGHAKQELDDIWDRLFQTTPIHIKQIEANHDHFQNAILVNTASAIGDEGFGLYGWDEDRSLPKEKPCENSTLDSFRNFVLKQYGISTKAPDEGEKSCNLTLLVRKNYVAHPRSNGRTDRTLANVRDDIAYLQSEYVNCKVTPVSFEEMEFQEQLKIISQSDVFVAVHGAGNIHVLFLPKHALFVEYFPRGFLRRRRFQYLAECLGISYLSKKAWIVTTSSDKKITVRLKPF